MSHFKYPLFKAVIRCLECIRRKWDASWVMASAPLREQTRVEVLVEVNGQSRCSALALEKLRLQCEALVRHGQLHREHDAVLVGLEEPTNLSTCWSSLRSAKVNESFTFIKSRPTKSRNKCRIISEKGRNCQAPPPETGTDGCEERASSFMI